TPIVWFSSADQALFPAFSYNREQSPPRPGIPDAAPGLPLRRRNMYSNFMDAVRTRSAHAIASGDLQPIEAEQVVIQERGLPFIVRWVAALAAKDAAARPAAQGAQAISLP